MIDTPKLPNQGPGQILPSTATQATIGRVPPGVAGLSLESLLNATVLGQDKAGNFILQTPQGELTVSSALALKAGNSLVLKILLNQTVQSTDIARGNLLQQFQAQVVSIDGKAPEPPTSSARQTAAPPAGNNPPPPPAAGQGAANPPPANNTARGEIPYNVVTAVQPGNVSAPEKGGQASQSAAAKGSEAALVQVSNGSFLKAVILEPAKNAAQFLPQVRPEQSSLPANLPAGASSSSSAIAPPAAPASYGVPAPSSPSAAAGLRAGDGITLHVISANIAPPQPRNSGAANPQIAPQGNSPAAASAPVRAQNPAQSTQPTQPPPVQPAQPPQPVPQSAQSSSPNPSVPAASGRPATITPVTGNPAFTATVIGTEKSGEAVLKTPLGIMKLPSEISLPQGSTLRLEVTGLAPQSAARIPLEGIALLTQGAGSISEMVAAIASQGNEAAKAALQRIIPQPDASFAAKLLWFIGGVHKGDASQWIGPQIAGALEQMGRKDLLDKLQKDFSQLKKLNSEGPTGGWNSLLFPVFDGKKLEHGMLFTRHYDDKDSDSERKKKGTRFVVELELTEMGEIQFDGFVKPQEAQSQFDLVIRSKSPISAEMQQDIREIFIASGEVTGVKGDLQFQVTDIFPVNPREDMAQMEDDEGDIFI